MSISKDPGVIHIGEGNTCPKCSSPMARYEHSKIWIPQPGRGRYCFWDRCFHCRHLQHYASAYVAADDAQASVTRS